MTQEQLSQAVEPELRAFQTWMQTFIVEPGQADTALAAAEKAAGLAKGSAQRLVKRSPTLDEMERLNIYRGMYLLRMEEALSIDFPATKQLLGSQRFFELVEDYVKVHPSKSWTLDHLGRQFPGFVQSHPLAGSFPGLTDMVRLEAALCEVFNAEEKASLGSEEVMEVPPERWARLTLFTIPALRLLRLSSNANQRYKAFNADQEWPAYQAGEQGVVVWRHQYKLWRMPLEENAFAMLSALHERNPIGVALNQVLGRHEVEEHEVFEWFSSWVNEGMFAGFELA